MLKLDLKEPLAYMELHTIYFNENARKSTVNHEKFMSWLAEKEDKYKAKTCAELLELIENKKGRCCNNDLNKNNPI